MNIRYRPAAIIAALASLALLLGSSVSATAQFRRPQGNPFKPPQASIHAPHARTYHVRHLKLELVIDAAGHSARGVVTHYLTPLQDKLAVVTMEAGANLNIESCRINGVDMPFKHEGQILTITPATPLSSRSEAAVEVKYVLPAGARGGGANGAGGFTWIDPRPGDPTRKPGFWTQGETETNRNWVPCYDYPNDKCTSETHTTVPDSWTVIGNGAEAPATVDPARHTKTYHWAMKQPHSTYLLSLAGGEMDVQKSRWAGVPLYYAVPKGMGDLIPTTYGHTPDMLEFFSKRFAYKYPWPKYAQVCAFDFPGGMENVSATTMGSPQGLMIDARSNHRGPDSLISHEMGHQWFGDLVTCADWGDVWLNEGFATFCEMLYTEHTGGKDAYEQDRAGALNGYLFENGRYKRPLSTNLYSNGDAMFGSGHTYSRGALTLHMLRRELGDKTFFDGISHYLKANAYQAVTTPDLIKALSETAGRDLTAWFDLWVFKPGHPVVNWSWSYDDSAKCTVLHLKQTQDTSEGTPIYSLPLKVALILPSSSATRSPVAETRVTFDRAEQEIRIPGAVRPDSVLIDPEHDLLMEGKPTGPTDVELRAQLRFAPSFQDRTRAARALMADGKGKNESTVKLLVDALSAETSDRAAAALIGLLADTKQESLRSVFRAQCASQQPGRRMAALAALGALPASPVDITLLRNAAVSDTESYDVVETALRALARADLSHNLDVFQHQAAMQSPRDRLANTVVGLLADTNLDPAVPVLLTAVGSRHQSLVRRNAIRAIGTLAPQSPAVHQALIAALKDDQSYVQTAAIDALKSRKDMGALDALRDMAANAKDSLVRSSAQDAVTELSTRPGG